MSSFSRRPASRAFYDRAHNRKHDHAVLYCRQYLKVSNATAQHFADLAMSRRWPALSTAIGAAINGAFQFPDRVKKHVDALKKIVS